jgi:hypothetical protein
MLSTEVLLVVEAGTHLTRIHTHDLPPNHELRRQCKSGTGKSVSFMHARQLKDLPRGVIVGSPIMFQYQPFADTGQTLSIRTGVRWWCCGS